MLLAGCDRVWRLDPIEGTSDAAGTEADADAELDADVDAVAPVTCFGNESGLFRPCISSPQGDLRLSGDLETTTDARCSMIAQSTGTPVCVIAAENIEVTGPLVARGTSPLVLVASGAIQVGAAIDASSNAGRRGAGAQGMCGTAGQGTDAVNGGGGGAGASFAFAGGGAAPGGGDNATAHAPDPVELLVDVRGGCTGYRGGLSTSAGGTAAIGGRGGGAVYLIAGQQIRVLAPINVSGSGGAAGPVRGGGGAGTTTAGGSGVDPSTHMFGGNGGVSGITGGGGVRRAAGAPAATRADLPRRIWRRPAEGAVAAAAASCSCTERACLALT